MHAAAIFVAAAVVTVIGCGGGYNLAGDSQTAAPLPAIVNCEDAAQLRGRAIRDRDSSRTRSRDLIAHEAVQLTSRRLPSPTAK